MYRERASRAGRAVLWQHDAAAGAVTRILPDGCLDLIWEGAELVVAGPDTRARLHLTASPAHLTGLRLPGGLGPAVLGVPAEQLRDRSLPLGDVWPAARARELAERIARAPATELEAWLAAECGRRPVDPLGPRLEALARAGPSVAAMADRAGLGERRLHRRCLELFGYGPRHLVRVLRFERALAQARAGAPLARVAHDCGYADQPHLARDVRDLAGVSATELLGRRPGVTPASA